MKIKALVAALMITATVASAQTRTPVINAREHNQEKRINQGVRNGELTHNETRTLRNDERKVNAEKRIAKSDGVVTHGERKMIRHQENRNSKTIYNKKHNQKKY